MKKIVLSGAISGHEEEAKRYFDEAEKAVKDRFPCCAIFNPTKLPKLPSWDHYMILCRTRICGWSNTIVFIINEYTTQSKGVAVEYELAKEQGLEMYNFENGKITEFKVK